MDRRHFLRSFSCFACAPLSFGFSSVGSLQSVYAQAITSEATLKILTDINDAVYGLKSGIEYTEWVIASATSLEANQASVPPPGMPHVPPTLGVPPFNWNLDLFEGNLRTSLSKARSITLPEFDLVLPAIGAVADSSKDATRADLRNRFEQWVAAAEQLRMGLQVQSLLKQLSLEARTQSFLISSGRQFLEDAIPRMMQETAQAQIAAESLGFGTYLSICDSIEQALLDKESGLATAVKERDAAIHDSARELNLALAVELQLLRIEADRLKAIGDGLKEEYDELSKLSGEINDLVKAENALADEKKALIRDIDKHNNHIVQLNEKIKQDNKGIDDTNEDLELPYTWCPNHASFLMCDHVDLKRQWTDRVNNLRFTLASYTTERDQFNKDISEDQLNIESENALLDSEQRQLVDYQEQEQKMRSNYNQNSKLYNDAKDAYDDDRMKSRSDLYYGENQDEQLRISELLQSIDK
jgi:hypothetical protein